MKHIFGKQKRDYLINLVDSGCDSAKNISNYKDDSVFMFYEMDIQDLKTEKKEHFYKVQRFVRIGGVKNKSDTIISLIHKQENILQLCYEKKYDVIMIIANIKDQSHPHGTMLLYGMQGIADNIDDAMKLCQEKYSCYINILNKVYSNVISLSDVSVEEVELLNARMKTFKKVDLPAVPREVVPLYDSKKDASIYCNTSDYTDYLGNLIAGMSDNEFVYQVIGTPVDNQLMKSLEAELKLNEAKVVCPQSMTSTFFRLESEVFDIEYKKEHITQELQNSTQYKTKIVNTNNGLFCTHISILCSNKSTSSGAEVVAGMGRNKELTKERIAECQKLISDDLLKRFQISIIDANYATAISTNQCINLLVILSGAELAVSTYLPKVSDGKYQSVYE